MQEVTQAAQRLRLAFECEEFAADMADLLTTDVDPQLPRDLSIVARAYLAEHAEDDDEAITEDWWHSQCCVETLTIPIDDEWYVSWNRFNGTILNSDSDAWMLEHITTRGQLRLLLRALQ